MTMSPQLSPKTRGKVGWRHELSFGEFVRPVARLRTIPRNIRRAVLSDKAPVRPAEQGAPPTAVVSFYIE
jgi:hypothetical protein